MNQAVGELIVAVLIFAAMIGVCVAIAWIRHAFDIGAWPCYSIVALSYLWGSFITHMADRIGKGASKV